MITWMKRKYLVGHTSKKVTRKGDGNAGIVGQRGRAKKRGPRYGNDSGRLFKGAAKRARGDQ